MFSTAAKYSWEKVNLARDFARLLWIWAHLIFKSKTGICGTFIIRLSQACPCLICFHQKIVIRPRGYNPQGILVNKDRHEWGTFVLPKKMVENWKTSTDIENEKQFAKDRLDWIKIYLIIKRILHYWNSYCLVTIFYHCVLSCAIIS